MQDGLYIYTFMHTENQLEVCMCKNHYHLLESKPFLLILNASVIYLYSYYPKMTIHLRLTKYSNYLCDHLIKNYVHTHRHTHARTQNKCNSDSCNKNAMAFTVSINDSPTQK